MSPLPSLPQILQFGKWQKIFSVLMCRTHPRNSGPSLSLTKLDMLRQHKPPPIQRIRILDFGLPDPKHDPDRHQNCITWSLSHALPLQKISSKSIHKFASNLTDRQTDTQTDRTENITSFFGGGNQNGVILKPILASKHQPAFV